MDTERFALLRQAVDLILSGTLVPAQALDTLNRTWGYRTRPTKAWASGPLNRASFYRWLANPFLMGKCRHKGVLYQGTHTPLVTPAEFEQLQAILARREKHRTHPHAAPSEAAGNASDEVALTDSRCGRHDFALTGLMRCAQCGQGMITATRAKGHIYYHCTNQRGACTRKGIRQESLLGEVAGHLGRVYLPEDLGDLLLQLTERHLQGLGVSGKAREAAARARDEAALSTVIAQQERLRGLLLREVVSEAEYVREKGRLAQEEHALHDALAARTSEGDEQARLMHTAREVVGFVTTVPASFPTLFPGEQRQAVRYLSGSVLPEGRHPRPRLDVSRTGQNLLLEPHPLLTPFVSYNQRLRSVEPGKSGSGSQKRLSDYRSVSFGRPDETLEQLAADFCEQIEQYSALAMFVPVKQVGSAKIGVLY